MSNIREKAQGIIAKAQEIPADKTEKYCGDNLLLADFFELAAEFHLPASCKGKEPFYALLVGYFEQKELLAVPSIAAAVTAYRKTQAEKEQREKEQAEKK